jgi:hypothetical protein
MTIFDLLFLLAALASLVTLVVAVVFAIRGRRAQALKTPLTYGVAHTTYTSLA